ncbi:MAG: hypothetical protein LBL46_04165 [Rickettsiales bacterium]|jgi:phage repressor protein C with HTH and peptisase S24 domain|nr:hypothetical protein [Rickettsiales bacterium]
MKHIDIWDAIDKFAKAHDKSCSGLARASGLDPTTFNKSKRFSRDGTERWPSVQTLAKILHATGHDRDISAFTRYLMEDGQKTA